MLQKLRQLLDDGKSLSHNDSMWDEIQDLILLHSPEFLTNLKLLAGGKLTKTEKQTALLIKLGFSPIQISKLSCKARNSISSRKEQLRKRIFEDKVDPKMLDLLIHLL